MTKQTYIGRFAAFCREAGNSCGNHWLPQGNWYTVQVTVYWEGGAGYTGATLWAQSPRDAAIRCTSLLGEVQADEDEVSYVGPADEDLIVARVRLATIAEVTAHERRNRRAFAAEEAARSEELPF